MSLCFDNCGSIHGVCNESAAYCECHYPWANLGDFVPQPHLACDINFEVSKALWIVAAVIYAPLIVLLVISLVYVRRGTKSRTRGETLTIVNLLIGQICGLAVSILEASASVPGERSIGIDMTTTCLFVVSEVLITFHAVFLPFIHSGTSVLPFAVMSSPTLSSHLRGLKVFFAGLFICILVSNLLVIWIVIDPQSLNAYAHSSFSLAFIVVLSSGVFTFIATQSLLNKISLIQRANRTKNLTYSQRDGMDLTKTRALGTRLISVLVIFLHSPQFLVFAVSSTALYRAAWAWIPLRKLTNCLFDYRHPYLSLTTSHTYHKTESQMKTHGNLAVEDHQVTRNAGVTTDMLLGTGNKLPSKKKKKKLLTRVEEERTVDIRTEMETGGTIPTF